MSMLDAPPVLHPLEPLARGGGQRRQRDPEGREGPRQPARASCSSPCTSRPRPPCRRARPSPREAFVVLYEKAERKTYEAVVSLTDEARRLLHPHRGRAAAGDVRGVHGLRGGRAGRPGLAGGDAPARRRGLLAGDDRSLGRGLQRPGGRPGRAADRPAADVGARRAGRARLRAADRGPRRRRRPRRDGGDRGRRPRRRPAAAQARQLRPGADGGRRTTSRPSRAPRADLKPIEITQPEGASFSVSGHGVAWQKWHVRVGFTPREGLVLHELGYDERPIIYRASLAEMYVPYGDPAPTHRFKNVFDQGEYGVGWLANPLTLGCDCVGEIHYFDGVVNDQDGEPMTIPNAVCMHEEDYGIGWKHTDFRTEEVEVRRLRRLVISSIATVGNYEYGYFWYLYTDGTIEYEVKLTGVISTGALEPGDAARSTARSSRPASTGRTTSTSSACGWTWRSTATPTRVVQVDSEPLPCGPENPTGTAWVTKRTVLETETQARGQIDPLQGPLLADREPGQALRARRPGRLQARPGRERRADVRAGQSRFAKRAGLHAGARVGDGVRPGRALRGRRLPEPAPGRRRRPALRGRRPPDREHRRGALVHVRRPPRRPPGGLAGDAGHPRRLQAQARRLLRRQPGARHAAVTPEALPHHRE